MGNSHKNHIVWNQQLNQNQTLMEQSFDGPFPKLCLAVMLSHQDGHHSAVALLLKTALIQVSDYRLLEASGFLYFVQQADTTSSYKQGELVVESFIITNRFVILTDDSHLQFQLQYFRASIIFLLALWASASKSFWHRLHQFHQYHKTSNHLNSLNIKKK